MKILIVDDDAVFRSNTAKFLSRLGHDVQEAGNGREAVTLLTNTTTQLVLADIRMPKMDGHELLKKIKSSPELKDIIIIMMTQYGGMKSAVEALREGAYDYVFKPLDLEELAIVLSKIQNLISLKDENRQLHLQFEKVLSKAADEAKNEPIHTNQPPSTVDDAGSFAVFSTKMKMLLSLAKKYHDNPDIPVLIQGETGTGKEMVARYIHHGSRVRFAGGPFIGLNCAVITPSLFESELFGYEPGAFTGGDPKGKQGKLEAAANGTIFLDEITELPLNFQAKLLRLLQEREFYRVGGIEPIRTNARFICATNEDIAQKIDDGTFRQDLFYRFNIGHLTLPPLRERKDEIFPLAKFFLGQIKNIRKTSIVGFDPGVEAVLQEYAWPGNVRELRNVIERVVLLTNESIIEPRHFGFLGTRETKPDHQRPAYTAAVQPPTSPKRITEWEMPDEAFDLNDHILSLVKSALDRNNGNKTKTARYLGISLSVLNTHLKHLDEKQD